jgi:glycosyltransferase involved in cell wall biosynthesis
VRVAFVTVGDTGRLTGGYLYNARVLELLGGMGVEVEEITPCGASPEEQNAVAGTFGSSFDPRAFDVVVVDALARIVCAPHLDRWREDRPVVAMVHELPSAAAPEEAPSPEDEEPLLRSGQLICVSRHGASILAEKGVPAARIHVVPPGSDHLPAHTDTPSPARDGRNRALCVAQWIPRKGILDLVQAWTLRERPDATLELIGETDADPAYEAAVHAAIASSGKKSIVVRGPVDDAALEAAYAAADVFALPSRYEGYGVVYAEALAHGLPVVACAVGPVPALVGEDAALLVPPKDVGALSGALDLILDDAGLRDRMSVAARRRAEALPRWEDTAAGFLRVLREAVAERTRGARRG